MSRSMSDGRLCSSLLSAHPKSVAPRGCFTTARAVLMHPEYSTPFGCDYHDYYSHRHTCKSSWMPDVSNWKQKWANPYAPTHERAPLRRADELADFINPEGQLIQ